jgi:replicative DNA helicase
LSDGVPRSTNIEHYARIIRAKASARALIYLANKLLVAAYEDEHDAAALVDEAERGLLDISEQAVPGDLVPAEQMVRNIYPVLESLEKARRPVTGLSTGFESLDRYTRGLQPGNLVILGGRPSQGKSTLATQIALHVSQSQPVAFFSIEMSQQEQAFRVLTTLGQLDGHRLQCGQLHQTDYGRLTHALEDFAGRQFWLDDTGTLTPLQIRSRARRLKARAGLGLIVVDYLQLLQHQKADSREQAVAHTGRLLKQIGRELSVPVLALCQLSRFVEQRQDQRPKLSDLRESGSLEQDADLVLLIHRPPARTDGGVATIPFTELIIAKQRNGPTHSIDLRWRGEQYRFLEADAKAA